MLSKLARTKSLPILVGLIICVACGDSSKRGGSGTAAGRSPWFRDIAEQSGVDFVHHSGHGEEFYTPEVVAGGVALLDADEDGNLDIYFVQAGGLEQLPGDRPGNQLFRNRGDATFETITEKSGADNRGYGIGVATGDANNDGHVDLYVTNVGANALLCGSGKATFDDTTSASGVGDTGFGTSAAFLDYDQDGDLDLYVANYLIWSVEAEKDCFNTLGQRDYCAPALYNAPAIDVLYRNEGKGSFADVTVEAGLETTFGTGLGIVASDFNADGLVDVFVANDGRPDQLWINLDGVRFEDQAMLLGCAMDQDGKAKAGMGVACADFDDDADIDVIVCNLRGESDSLFINEHGSFSDATASSGLGTTSRGFTRFGMGWLDFDNDGWLDLYQANGRVAMDVDGHGSDDLLAEPNLLFRGRQGRKFEEVAPRGGTELPLIHTSRGAAFGDLDNDGGMDIVVSNRDAAPYILLNNAGDSGNWLLVRVLDGKGRDDLGATVEVRVGERTIRREVRTAYSYCVANDPRVHFGLGSTTKIDALKVIWTNGQQRSIEIKGLNQVYVIRP